VRDVYGAWCCKHALVAIAAAIALMLFGIAAGAAVREPSVTEPVPNLSSARRAKEAVFMRTVKPNLTANEMTSDVLGHVGDRVAFICTIEEITRPGVVVGQCGSEGEPVDLYLKLPGTWRAKDRVRVLGSMDTPASWSDVGGHTIYYPFVNVVFADRIR
jgi:hypothetical protein